MMRRALSVLVTSWLALLAAAVPAAAADALGAAAAKEESGPPLRFRRVFAPADRMADWPRGALKYLPVDAAEFDRLLSTARSPAAGAGAPSGVRIVMARYTARWDEAQTLRGEATWEIPAPGSGAALLALEPCELALGKARWLGAEPPPAVLGSDEGGTLRMVVERGGTAAVTWSLTGRRDEGPRAVFSFALPPCPVNELTLDLPPGLVPAVDHGIVVESRAAGEELRRWTIALGGHNRFHLRIAPAGAAAESRGVALARQSMVYDLSRRGMEVSAQLKLEAHDEPLRQVTLLMDPQLQLVTALRGDAAAPWSVVSPPGSRLAKVVVTLPAPIRDGTGVLRLRALAPLVVGEPWRLPRIYPEGVFWQEGSATLRVPAPLVIGRLVPVGCRQSGAGPLSAAAAGESAQFEYFAPDATVELLLAQRRAALQVLSATATELGNGKITARVAADFHTGDATLFALEARVAPPWTVDSIESAPADALDDWSFDRPDDPAALSIRLAKALAAHRPLRLVIVARRLYAGPGAELGIGDLLPLQFPAATEERQLVAVRASGAYQVKVAAGEKLARLAAADLPAAQRDLFAEPPGELLFENDAGAAGLRVALESRKPSYAAEIEVEACVGNETLREDYRFHCTPAPAAHVDHLLVRFSHRRGGAVRWSLGKEDPGALAARRWPVEEQVAVGRPPEEETWELTLRRPRSEAFEIRASRETKLTGLERPEPVSLAALPDATQTPATLVLRAVGEKSLQIINHRLKAVAVGAPPPGECQTVRAAYQYDPVADASAVPEPPLLLWTTRRTCVPRAWVWQGELRSHYAPDGTGQHVAAYRLQSCGETTIHLRLAPGTFRRDVHGLWIDGVRTGAHPGRADDRNLAIDLPANEQFPTVTILFSTRGDRLRAVAGVAPPLPESDVPILWQNWSVWLPPGYELAEYLPDGQRSVPRQFTWNQRLFGPLGRGAPEPPAADAASPSPAAGATPTAKSPWANARSGGLQTEDAPGWTGYRLPVTKSVLSGLVVVHRATLRLWGALAFLLVVAIGWWLLAGRPWAMAAAAVALAVTALLVPAAYIPIGSGAVLGAGYCLLAGGLRRLHAAPAARETSPPQPASAGAAAGLPTAVVLALGLLLWGSAAHGAPPEKKAAASKAAESGTPEKTAAETKTAEKKAAEKKTPSAPYSVFVPVDEHQQPSGGKYYVPEPFYDRLYRRAASLAEKPQGWLMAGGVYRAALAKEEMSQRLAVEELRAEFDLHVFSNSVRVRIPFSRDEVQLLPGASQLDGRAIQPQWSADGSALVVEIPEPGQFRLELALGPTLRNAAGGSGFSLAIPRLATARLELTLPEGAPPIEVPSACGAIRQEEQATRLVAELGPADRLTVRWQDPAGAAGAAPVIDADELFWLKIQPGSVVIDARLKLKVAAGQMRSLQLIADPSLQMLPLVGPDPPAIRVRTPAGQPQVIELQWARPVTDATVVDAEFLLTGASSVGNLRLPQLDLADVRAKKRWLAVSIDPALEHREQMPGRREAVAVPEFAASWGAAKPTPLWARVLAPGASRWSINTRPRQPEITVDKTLALDFDGHEATVELDARLTASSGGVFQHRLLAPAGLKVDRVAVSAGGCPRASRWTVDPSGAITVFLMDPASGPHELSLRGRLPAAAGTKLPLPRIEVDSARVQSFTVQLYRRPSVLVEVQQADGLTEVKEPPAEARGAERDRLVGWFRAAKTGTPAATLAVLPNRPRVEARQVIRLAREGASWTAALDCRLKVSDGVLDQVVLDAPAWRSAKLKIKPSGLRLVEDRDSGRLTLRPRTAISGDYQFTLRGPLAVAAGQPASVPQIGLYRVHGGTRFVVLPTRVAGEPIAWDVQGLQAVHLPELAVSAEEASYQVVGTPLRAVVRAAEPSRGGARVRRADIRLAWQLDGSCRGVASFEVEPGKTPDCPLWLPAGFRLVQTTVGGVPMPPSPVGVRTWMLPLGSEAAAERVEVVFDGGSGEGANDETAGGPSDAAPPGAGIETAGMALPFSSTARWRFRAPMLGQLPVEQTRWIVAGPERLGAGEPEAREASASGSPGQTSTLQGDVSVPPDAAAALWQASLEGRQPPTVCVLGGRADSLVLRYAAVSGGGLPGRFAAAVLVAALAAAVALGWRRRVLGPWLAQRPYACAIALGLAWWLWLWPGEAGVLVALAAVALHWARRLNHRARQSPRA
jgi:hypothetical protein